MPFPAFGVSEPDHLVLTAIKKDFIEGGKRPTAVNDQGSTLKGTPVTLNILANDRNRSDDDDDDDDNDNEIDKSSVDLNTSTDEIEKTRVIDAGIFSVDNEGMLTFSPEASFVGLASISYTVKNYKEEISNAALVEITVVAQNDDAPEITGQNPNPLVTREDEPVEIGFGNLIVSDEDDDDYPSGFSMKVANGENYSVSERTVSPATNFFGTLLVPVVVNDGSQDSDPFNVQISVTALNDAPTITGQSPDPLTTSEGQPLEILLSNLIVDDPDSDYPEDFTLAVQPGDNYSVSGNTIAPNENYSGSLTVGVIVSDGSSSSNTYGLKVTVSSSNDVPVITGQSPLSALEDNAITVRLQDLQVVDDDNAYPTGFSLTLGAGSNYSLSGNSVIPSPNFNGTLAVPATVNDGTDNSSPYNLQITVTPENDAPTITGQQPLSTNENQPLAISLSDLTVEDIDNVYPNGFALSLLSGENYSVTGNTITPASGFSGNLNVGSVVNDGAANSAVFTLVIFVNAVNDAPVITGQQSLTSPEDTSFLIQLAHLVVEDSDNSYPSGFTLTVLEGVNYSFSENTVTPAADFVGTLMVNVKVNDGTSDSAPFGFQVTITPVNDAPVITGQQSVAVNEDAALDITVAQLIIEDPDNSSGLTLTVGAGVNYTVSGVTVIPLENFSGTLSVPVQVHDGELNSNVFSLQVTVVPVNDVPAIVGQVPVTIAEDASFTIALSDLSVIDIDNNYPNGFSLTVSPGSNYTLSGNTVTPIMDFNGTLNIGISVSDGTSSSEQFLFQIQVGDSNDAPVITGQSSLSTNEEQAVTIELGHLTVSDPDNAYPAGFTLLVSLGENYTVSGNTVTPSLNFAGELLVPVRVNDGVNNSPTFNFKILVNQINDAPSFSPIANIVTIENRAGGQVSITGISKGPLEESQQLTFFATSGNTAVIPNPTVVYNGGTTATLNYALTANASGIVTITVMAVDNGPAGAPHVNTFSSTFQIAVLEVNQPPTIDPISDVTLNEDAPASSVALSGITAGPGESQTIMVQVSTNRPELFEILRVEHTSPNTSGILTIKPAANISGLAKVTVTVTDNGSSVSPSSNTTSRDFTLRILPVNDLPTFTTNAPVIAVVGESYQYLAKIIDLESNNLPMSLSVKPAWLTLNNLGNGQARISGTPSKEHAGTSEVVLHVNDGEMVVEQRFSILVNRRPTVASFELSTDEDTEVPLSTHIQQAYIDADGHNFSYFLLTRAPSYGAIIAGDQAIGLNDTVPSSSFASLVYLPELNYSGEDLFQWKASDGYHFSGASSTVSLKIDPINDPPAILLEQDTLLYDVNGEARAITSILEISDPDNEVLVSGTIRFNAESFDPVEDVLTFRNTVNIQGQYDYVSGTLSMSGTASLREYEEFIKDVSYNHLNILDPVLRLKRISISLSDGELSSEPKERLLMLDYTFVDLEIPTGFTPNGDQVNDTWVITRPDGIDQLTGAVIRVYNARGVQVFRTEGFSEPWDGMSDGQLLPAGSYYFTIDLNLRNKKIYKGIVTLLR